MEPYREGFGGTGGWAAGHDLLMCDFSPETKHTLNCISSVASRPREGIFSLLCTREILTWMQYCTQFSGSLHRKDIGPVRGDPEEAMRKGRGLGHLSYADRLRAKRTESSRETFLCKLQYFKRQRDLLPRLVVTRWRATAYTEWGQV